MPSHQLTTAFQLPSHANRFMLTGLWRGALGMNQTFISSDCGAWRRAPSFLLELVLFCFLLRSSRLGQGSPGRAPVPGPPSSVIKQVY